ncbi:MAG TPA: retropepsin-like aspartic protease, partial [Rhizomicrobium sp.]
MYSKFAPALLCVFSLAFIPASAHADGCKLVRIASFDFTENGSLIVPVTVTGTSEPVAIDTGSPISAIDPGVVDKLHLPEHEISQGTMFDLAGESAKYVSTLHDLGLGGMHASDVQFLVWPSPMTKDGNLAGTIGADLLRHYDVDIDFAAHRLALFSQDHCPGQVVYWTTGAVAVVPMHIVGSGHIVVPV